MFALLSPKRLIAISLLSVISFGVICYHRRRKMKLNKKLLSLSSKSTTTVLKMITRKPMKMWIDGRCFEVRDYNNAQKKRPVAGAKMKNNLREMAIAVESESTQVLNNVFEITTGENGKLHTRFRLPTYYYVKLASFPEFTVAKLAKETNTEIIIPKYGRDGSIIISGENETNIKSASEELQSVLSEIRRRCVAMQFISIPVLSDEVKKNFEKFKAEILNGEPIKGMDETIFQNSLKLHLTVVVFALFDELEKREAINALKEYKTSVLDPLIAETGPLKVEIAGIDCMNNNVTKVDVLYANAKIINETEKANLQTIANGISNYFYDKGLLRKNEGDVKLHVTLINTKYRKSANSSPAKNKRWVKRQQFDARSIMEKYKNYYFGTCNFDAIHLSLMGSIGDDGYYKPLSIINI